MLRTMTASCTHYQELRCTEFDRDGAQCELPMNYASAADPDHAQHRTTHDGQTHAWTTGITRRRSAPRSTRYL